MAIFGTTLRLWQTVYVSVCFYKVAEKNTGTLSEFSANDAEFSVNAKEVWSSFVDTDKMIQVGMISFKSFLTLFKDGFS